MNKVLIFSGIFALSLACGKPAPVTPPPGGDQPPVTPPVVTTTPDTPVPVVVNTNMGPMESIKHLDARVETYQTGPNLTPDEIEKNKKLKAEIIRGTFDIAELSRMALDAHWEKLTEKERADFITLMTDLLEKKAVLSKEQVKDTGKPYNISYKSEEYLDPEKSQSLVVTKLTVPSSKIDLSIRYKLKTTPNGWKIFDVIVDDASLVDNYKFQFDTIIKSYGYPELVTRMQKKLKEMQ